MDLKNLVGSIAQYAPTLGGAIGGPVGSAVGLAVSALAKAFGLAPEATPDEINQAIVDYDKEGRPDYVAYDRLVVPLLKLVQELHGRLQKLEA